MYLDPNKVSPEYEIIYDKFPDGYEDVGTIVKNTTTITSGEIIKNWIITTKVDVSNENVSRLKAQNVRNLRFGIFVREYFKGMRDTDKYEFNLSISGKQYKVKNIRIERIEPKVKNFYEYIMKFTTILPKQFNKQRELSPPLFIS